LETARKPIVHGLKCADVAAVLAAPFKTPFAGATAGHSVAGVVRALFTTSFLSLLFVLPKATCF
jgi:hypothetical protein